MTAGDIIDSIVCGACLGCYVPWLRKKWVERAKTRRLEFHDSTNPWVTFVSERSRPRTLLERLRLRWHREPGCGWPVPATGLHGARQDEQRRAWLLVEVVPLGERVNALHAQLLEHHEQAQRDAEWLQAHVAQTNRIDARLEHQLRAAQGCETRKPTYAEAVEMMAMRRRYEPLPAEPCGSEAICWHGEKIEP